MPTHKMTNTTNGIWANARFQKLHPRHSGIQSIRTHGRFVPTQIQAIRAQP